MTAIACHNPITSAQTWTPASVPPNEGLVAIASSADGNKLFAITGATGQIYITSTNAGATWGVYTEPQWLSGGSAYGSWNCIASSADGNTLLAMNDNAVWVSTNSGGSWVSNVVAGVSWWTSVALSADGTKAVAVVGNSWSLGHSTGGIYTSTNSGMTWSQTTAPIEPWTSVASSADGTILAATGYGSSMAIPVYISTNSGLTWMPAASPANVTGNAVACSADGHKIIMGGYDVTSASEGQIYTSTDLGNTWVSNNVSGGVPWYGVASSADGTRLIACSDPNSYVVTSTNSGTTWISNSLPDLEWTGVAASADGAKLAASYGDRYYPSGIYTSQTTPIPQLSSSLTNGTMTISWLIPSTAFILQQSSDLAGWSDVTNTPVLNLTNLENQIALPVSAANAFYRLVAP